MAGILGEFSVVRERPKRDDDNREPHLVDHHVSLHLKPLFHFTIQKLDNTRAIQMLHQMSF